MSLRRIKKELNMDYPDDINVTANDNDLYKLQAILVGPENTVYENGVFFINITIPMDYPFKPPKIKFNTKIYHCNINEKGEICLPIIKEEWSPSNTIKDILCEIKKLLINPNISTPLMPEIAKLYQSNKKLYEKNAKEYTIKYAQ